MPQVPNVQGQPRKPTTLTQPAIEDDDKGQAVPVATLAKEPEPEPPLIHTQKGQDELAALAGIQQSVPQRRTMTPNDPAYKFTDEDRKEAIKARWESKYDWEEADVDEALAYLAAIRSEVEKGGLVLQRRVSELKVERVKCFGCTNIINLSEGRYATMRTRNNFETGLPESAYACSAACGLKLNRDFGHPVRVPMPIER